MYQCLNIKKAKKKYVSILRDCKFYDLSGFNTFQPNEKTYTLY